MINKLKERIKQIFTIIRKPVMSILPGQLAFSFVLTIIPFIVLVSIIASVFSLSLDWITTFISNTFPKAVSAMLLPLIDGRGFDLSILIFLITAIYLASTGAYSVITAADVIYEIKPQKPLPKRIKAFIMTFVLITLIMFMIIVPAFGDKILKLLLSFIKSDTLSNRITIVYYILKYPISFFLIYFNIKLVYTIAPNKEIKSKTVTTGSIFTTIMWMITTQIYSFWVSNVAHYDIFYGSISNIIILLIWFYILSYVFVIGLVMNAGIDKGNIENNIKGWVIILHGL